MKYIKTYENTGNDFLSYVKRKQQLEKEKLKFCENIDQYINIHRYKWNDWYLKDYNNCIDFDLEDDCVVIIYLNSKKQQKWFDIQEKEDFLLFMKDPELYRNIKKYNL